MSDLPQVHDVDHAWHATRHLVSVMDMLWWYLSVYAYLRCGWMQMHVRGAEDIGQGAGHYARGAGHAWGKTVDIASMFFFGL